MSKAISTLETNPKKAAIWYGADRPARRKQLCSGWRKTTELRWRWSRWAPSSIRETFWRIMTDQRRSRIDWCDTKPSTIIELFWRQGRYWVAANIGPTSLVPEYQIRKKNCHMSLLRLRPIQLLEIILKISSRIQYRITGNRSRARFRSTATSIARWEKESAILNLEWKDKELKRMGLLFVQRSSDLILFFSTNNSTYITIPLEQARQAVCPSFGSLLRQLPSFQALRRSSLFSVQHWLMGCRTPSKRQ